MESTKTNTKIEINKVKNRFLPLAEAVANGLEPESKITDFIISKSLGEGSFGKVNLVTHIKTGGVYAIKSIDKKNKTNQEGKPYFRREIEIMYKVHHPNIVRLFSHFEDDDCCYFIMEYISKGNLYSILSKQKSKCFENKTVAYFIRDLISAVYYLHNMDPSIVHRDIKPENVLLHEDGKLKLTDFGWSNYINENEVRATYCGTPVYLAPEMIKEIGHDIHLDIWCIGVLTFELLTGTIPFPGNNMNVLSENILKTKINWPKDINMDAKNLISKILKPDPKDRISLVDMLKHPFFTKTLSNPTEFLFTPKELEDVLPYKPYLINVDLPTGYVLKSESEKKKEKVKEIKENISNETFSSNNNIKETTKTSSNDQVLTSQNNQYSGVINLNVPIKSNVYSDMTPNIKELYDKLKLDYESLTNSYNDLVHSKSEVNKKIDNLTYREDYFKQEKENLLKELDDKDNEKLNLQKIIAELNQRLTERENKLNNMANLLSLLRDKCKKEEEENEKLNNYIDKLTEQKDEEVKEYKEKMSEMQNKLMKDDNLENQISGLRQSISGMGDKMNMTSSTLTSSTNDTMQDYRKKLDEELRETKDYLAGEMENLRKEMNKEREKYSLIVKNKDDEIKKLSDEKVTIKENEAEKYKKIFAKYETMLKEREIEVEGLKSKVKKMENIIAVNNLRK
jgi:aurora kinase